MVVPSTRASQTIRLGDLNTDPSTWSSPVPAENRYAFWSVTPGIPCGPLIAILASVPLVPNETRRGSAFGARYHSSFPKAVATEWSCALATVAQPPSRPLAAGRSFDSAPDGGCPTIASRRPTQGAVRDVGGAHRAFNRAVAAPQLGARPWTRTELYER